MECDQIAFGFSHQKKYFNIRRKTYFAHHICRISSLTDVTLGNKIIVTVLLNGNEQYKLNDQYRSNLGISLF